MRRGDSPIVQHVVVGRVAAGLRRWPIVLAMYGVLVANALAGELGAIPPGGFQSPEGDPRFTEENGATPINNLVLELLNQSSPGAASHAFTNPRDGWVYVRVEPVAAARPGTALLDADRIALRPVEQHLEAMAYVAEGAHTIQLPPPHDAANRLEVRAIGDLVYAAYGSDPHIPEMGDYTWAFLRKHCLDHYNGMIGASTVDEDGKSVHESEIREWTAQGKRWYTLEPLPYDVSSADEVYERWASSPGLKHPLMSGIWVDEFGVGTKYGKNTADMYPHWVDAINRVRDAPEFADRVYFGYGPARMLPEDRFQEMVPYVNAIVEGGYRFGCEWYLPESQSRPGRIINRTEDLINELSPGWEMNSRTSFEGMRTGAATSRVIVVALFSEPGWETGDLFPNYDFNVFLDGQLQFIATDPAFFGIRGIQGYLSSYCGEEQVRLFARLVRHYAIEGNTERYLSDPYVLHHIQNGDFADGLSAWDARPAEEGAIEVKTAPGFGALQAKYHAPEGAGDTALWTRRSGSQPNVIAQRIQGLTPGRLYSLRFITGDYQEFVSGSSSRVNHAVSVTVENGEMVADKCFQAIVQAGFWQDSGAFNRNNPYWLNYHQHVFRAEHETAELALSDWMAPTEPGGAIDGELIWNFVQVQPYFEERD